jgi:hypothetical protein
MILHVEKAKKLDPRVVRTRQMLRDALVSLIEEKGFDAITVQDITDRAEPEPRHVLSALPGQAGTARESLRDAIDELMADIGASTGEQGRLVFDESLRPIQATFEHVALHAQFYRVMLSAEGWRRSSWGARLYGGDYAEVAHGSAAQLAPEPGAAGDCRQFAGRRCWAC